MQRHTWTQEDTDAVIEYKKQVRAGKIHPVKFTGNLKELIEA